MNIFVHHIPSNMAFMMSLSPFEYAEVKGLTNAETQDVPFVENEIKRRFGDKPHFLDVETTVCAFLANHHDYAIQEKHE